MLGGKAFPALMGGGRLKPRQRTEPAFGYGMMVVWTFIGMKKATT